MGQPDVRLHELNKRLQQRGEVSMSSLLISTLNLIASNESNDPGVGFI